MPSKVSIATGVGRKGAGIIDDVIKWLKREPAHYKAPGTGIAAKKHFEKHYIENPNKPFLLGLITPKSWHTKFDRTVSRIDQKLGEIFTKPGQKEGIFIKKEYVAHPKVPGLFLEHHYPSAMAPVEKASAFAAPILASMYIGEKLSKRKKLKNEIKDSTMLEKTSKVLEGNMRKEENVLVPRSQLEKTASALRKVHEINEKMLSLEKTASLRDRAEKVAFLMVEKGTIPSFSSYDEFQEKIAALMKEDLDIVEKALEYNTQKLTSIGEVSNRPADGSNPWAEFMND